MTAQWITGFCRPSPATIKTPRRRFHRNCMSTSRLKDERDTNARHALAWAYLNTGATDRAQSILSVLERGYRERQAQGWLHLSVDLAMFAQNAVLAGDADLAIDRLRQAVEAGWRDYYSVSNDPRWKSLRE